MAMTNIEALEEKELNISKSTRYSGMSTRRIDAYIQDLFTFGKITVRDNLIDDKYYQGNLDRDLIRRIMRRLQLEHSAENEFVVNYGLKTIQVFNSKFSKS